MAEDGRDRFVRVAELERRRPADAFAAAMARASADVRPRRRTADLAHYAVVGEQDGIAPPAVMKRRVEALRKAGTQVEYREYEGLGHGFGLGTGTSAEGWVFDAVRFWETSLRAFDSAEVTPPVTSPGCRRRAAGPGRAGRACRSR